METMLSLFTTIFYRSLPPAGFQLERIGSPNHLAAGQPEDLHVIATFQNEWSPP